MGFRGIFVGQQLWLMILTTLVHGEYKPAKLHFWRPHIVDNLWDLVVFITKQKKGIFHWI